MTNNLTKRQRSLYVQLHSVTLPSAHTDQQVYGTPEDNTTTGLCVVCKIAEIENDILFHLC